MARRRMDGRQTKTGAYALLALLLAAAWLQEAECSLPLEVGHARGHVGDARWVKCVWLRSPARRRRGATSAAITLTPSGQVSPQVTVATCADFLDFVAA